MEMNDPQQMRADIEEKYNLNESAKYISFSEEKKQIVRDVLIKYNPTKYHFGGICRVPHSNEEEKKEARRVSLAMNRALHKDEYRIKNKHFMRKYRAESKVKAGNTNEICVN